MSHKTHIIRYFSGPTTALLWCGRIMHELAKMPDPKSATFDKLDDEGKCKKCLQALRADGRKAK